MATPVVEAVAEGLEGAAVGLEEAAVITRRINANVIGSGFIGLGVGIAIGFFVGYRLNRAKIRAEAFKQSEGEVEKIREMYREATAAREKPSLNKVVEEKGYSVEVTEEITRPTRPPVPVSPAPPLTREELYGSKNDNWSFPEELANRTPDRPYIIHQDEYRENGTNYDQEVLTWYSVDSVLTDEEEQPMNNPDDVVGMENLDKFGHGADDLRVVFIRNDGLQMEYEVCLVQASYEEEAQGLSNNDEAN